MRTCLSSLTHPIREKNGSRPFVVADVCADTNSKLIMIYEMPVLNLSDLSVRIVFSKFQWLELGSDRLGEVS